MDKKIDLELSSRQLVLLIWIVDICFNFLHSWNKLDLNIKLSEISAFKDYLDGIFREYSKI